VRCSAVQNRKLPVLADPAGLRFGPEGTYAFIATSSPHCSSPACRVPAVGARNGTVRVMAIAWMPSSMGLDAAGQGR
jgi:hypothetical protein